MTEYDQIELGEYCENLIQEENFAKLVKLFEQQTSQDFLNTKPEEKQKREGIHASYVGFANFLGLMAAFVEAKNTILKSQNPELPEDAGALAQEID